jgi:hypothetical protein
MNTSQILVLRAVLVAVFAVAVILLLMGGAHLIDSMLGWT